DVGIFQPANLQEAMLGTPIRPDGGLIDKNIDLTTAQRPAVLPDHARLVLDLRRFGNGYVAKNFVSRSIGHDDDVSGLSALADDTIHAADKGDHDREQEDDHGESRGRHDGGFPAYQ